MRSNRLIFIKIQGTKRMNRQTKRTNAIFGFYRPENFSGILKATQWGHHSQIVEKIIFFCKLHRNFQKINYYLFGGTERQKNSN